MATSKRWRLFSGITLLIVVVLCLCNLLRVTRHLAGSSAAGEAGFCEMWVKVRDAAARCISEKLSRNEMKEPDTFWREMDGLLDVCAAPVRDHVKLLKLFIDEEHIGDYMRYADRSYPRTCVSVSVGVANASNELSLHRLHPTCRMIAADPDLERGVDFKNLGKFYPVNIGTNDKDTKQYTDGRKPNQIADKVTNRTREISGTAMEFLPFLRTANVSKVIDFMRINAKPMEYRLMPYFYRQGTLEREGITVCQLDMVLHGHPKTLGMKDTREWRQTIMDFLMKSDFMPVWSKKEWPNLKMTLINYRSAICYQRFYRSSC